MLAIAWLMMAWALSPGVIGGFSFKGVGSTGSLTVFGFLGAVGSFFLLGFLFSGARPSPDTVVLFLGFLALTGAVAPLLLWVSSWAIVVGFWAAGVPI